MAWSITRPQCCSSLYIIGRHRVFKYVRRGSQLNKLCDGSIACITGFVKIAHKYRFFDNIDNLLFDSINKDWITFTCTAKSCNFNNLEMQLYNTSFDASIVRLPSHTLLKIARYEHIFQFLNELYVLRLLDRELPLNMARMSCVGILIHPVQSVVALVLSHAKGGNQYISPQT